MRNCQSCGKLGQPNTNICNHCGKHFQESEPKNKQEKDETTEQEQTTTSCGGENQSSHGTKKEQITNHSNTDTSREKKSNQHERPPSKKTKLIIFSSVAMTLLFIGGYVLGNYLTSVNHLLEEFETAIQEKDTEKLADLLIVDHEELELTEDSLDSFIKLFDSQDELNDLMNHLKDQARYGSTSDKIFPIDLIEDGKTFIMFDNYQLSINPVDVKVSTNYKDTDIMVNGEIVATIDTDDFEEGIGPLIPGEYMIEAVHDTGFFHLKTEKNIKVIDPSSSKYADLSLEGEDVRFNVSSDQYEDLKSIKLFVDGKDTGWNIAENDRFGPLLTDGSLNASFEAKFPWGTVRTNDIPINDSSLDVNLGNSDLFKQEMMDVIVLFNEEFVEAFTSADVTNLSTTTTYFAEALLDEIVLNKSMNIEYEGSFNGLDFDMDSFELKLDDGYWNVTVDTIAYFKEAFYEKGNKPQLEQIEEELRYELMYDPQMKDWVVANIDFPEAMEEDEMERYKVSDPVVHSSDWASLDKDLY